MSLVRTVSKTILTLIMAFVVTNTATPPKAEALIIIAMTKGGIDPDAIVPILCVILLPFCILDEKADASTANSISKQDLLDNGYTLPQADQLIAEHQVLVKSALDKNVRLALENHDTQASVATQIRTLMPQASDLFVNFYSQLAIR